MNSSYAVIRPFSAVSLCNQEILQVVHQDGPSSFFCLTGRHKEVKKKKISRTHRGL